MYYEKIYLEDYFPNLLSAGKKTLVTFYIPGALEEGDAIPYSCVVICPGGGYSHISKREGEPVALRLVGFGIAAAVVEYTCEKGRYPMQLLQILATITYVRRNSEKLRIHPERIAVMGFSAGGHVACSAGLFWREQFVQKTLGIYEGEDQPNGMILCYPVITSGEYAHRESFACLLGENPDSALLEKVSLEKQVTKDTPQTFLWHTAEDRSVPVENSLLFAAALHKKGVPVELHIYPYGHHGLSLCDETVNKLEEVTEDVRYCFGWMMQCIRWIKEVLPKKNN